MAQWLKALAAKADVLSSILSGKKELDSQKLPCNLQMALPPTHTT